MQFTPLAQTLRQVARSDKCRILDAGHTVLGHVNTRYQAVINRIEKRPRILDVGKRALGIELGQDLRFPGVTPDAPDPIGIVRCPGDIPVIFADPGARAVQTINRLFLIFMDYPGDLARPGVTRHTGLGIGLVRIELGELLGDRAIIIAAARVFE